MNAAFNQKYDLALNHPVFLNQQQSFRKFSDRQEVWCKDQSRAVHGLGLSRYFSRSVLNQLQMSDQFYFLLLQKAPNAIVTKHCLYQTAVQKTVAQFFSSSKEHFVTSNS